jgi:hypothetical protein
MERDRQGSLLDIMCSTRAAALGFSSRRYAVHPVLRKVVVAIEGTGDHLMMIDHCLIRMYTSTSLSSVNRRYDEYGE